MHLYHQQFSEELDFPRVEKPTRVLIIASTPRSGSHMLGHALHQTNCFGFPLEYTNPANLAEWKRRLGKEHTNEVLTEIQRRRTSQNGVFGIKIHYSHVKEYGSFTELKRRFPEAYYVLLSRKDVLKQAISLSIARQTGVWIHGQQPKNDNPQYSLEGIDKCLRSILRENSSWRYALAANGCKFIEMDFDAIRNNLPVAINRIADFVGIKVDTDSIPSEQVTQQQSRDINAEWERQFLSDYKGGELFSQAKPGLLPRLKSRFFPT